VLRGPQSALHGFNAIAGAINVITKQPTDELASRLQVSYGNGAYRQADGVISGAIVPNQLRFRLSASYLDDAGRIRSASNGLSLDFRDQKQVHLRLLFTPTDRLEINLQGDWDREHNGSAYQDKLPSAMLFDTFEPAYAARRAFPGFANTEIYRVAARVRWDLDPVSLSSVTAYSHTRTSLVNSICYDDPNDPALPSPVGGAQCVFGPAFGQAAYTLPAPPPGVPVDQFYRGENDYRSVYEDLRLSSRDTGAFEWTVGGSLFHRISLDGFDAGILFAPSNTFMNLFPMWNGKSNNWWGVYGQLTWKPTSRLELTAAARYDDERYANTRYTSRAETTIVPVLSPAGIPIDRQHEQASAFQPKGQVSFHFTDDVMAYATVSRGFRAGYYFEGGYAVPEHTTNYELGLKTTLADRRIMLNVAAFHIDYSNQQSSTLLPDPPFLVEQSFPKTRIDGFELESTVRISRFLTFSFGGGYLNSMITNSATPSDQAPVIEDAGKRSPFTAKFNANASIDFSYPLFSAWALMAHLDDRWSGNQYADINDTQLLSPKNFVNARLGVQSDRYAITGFVRNATDERMPAILGASFIAGGWTRVPNPPRSYGVEVRVTF
jgi:iron complex outermembrane receptor protein